MSDTKKTKAQLVKELEALRMQVKELEKAETEYKKTEKALRKSKEKYKSLTHQIPVGVYRTTPEGKILYASPATAAIFGYENVEELCKIPVMHFYGDPEERERQMFQRNEKAVLSSEFKLITKQGKEIWVRDTGNAILDKNGEIAYFDGIIEDITGEKQVKEALAYEEYLLRTIMDNVPDCIYFKDTQCRFTRVNKEMVKKFEVKDESEMLGKMDSDFFTEEHARMAFEDEQEIMRTGQVLKREEKETWQNGRLTWTLTAKMPMRDKDGRIVGTFGVSRDVTARKVSEESLKLSKKVAEKADKAKGEFLANMSHEIRTPMNSVMGMTDLLLEMGLNREQKEYAEIIKQSSASLLDIINDILDFSKIEAGKLELENRNFNLRNVLENLIDTLALKADNKDLELIFLVKPEVPSLFHGDPGRLRQVLMNLLGNAIKFTHHGEVTLQVELDREETDDWILLRFTVADTGIGIGKNKIQGLFDAFTQVDGSAARKYGGTGLGLTISKQLVEMMGGTIAVKSRMGKGSTFSFTVRLKKRPEQGTGKKKETVKSLRGGRVLVVENNEMSRNVLENMLTSWECRYNTASDADDALEKLRKAARSGEPFDIAVINMQMPGTDGETLGIRIKQDNLLKNISLALLTSIGRRGDAARLEKEGFGAYLTKPVKESQLHDFLMILMGRKPVETPLHRPIITRYSVEEDRKRAPRLLLVEDNLINQKYALKVLDKIGYRADVASNGLEALKAMESTSYDLVLMDVQMPEMDGLETTKHIRENEGKMSKGRCPIIAITAHALKGNREKCLDAGMDDYISKPVKPVKLAETITRWLPLEFRKNVPEAAVSRGAGNLDG